MLLNSITLPYGAALPLANARSARHLREKAHGRFRVVGTGSSISTAGSENSTKSLTGWEPTNEGWHPNARLLTERLSRGGGGGGAAAAGGALRRSTMIPEPNANSSHVPNSLMLDMATSNVPSSGSWTTIRGTGRGRGFRGGRVGGGGRPFRGAGRGYGGRYKPYGY
ncbi:hypothetical protein B0H13DRAFT_1894405 [Mycena leptocephala]|nr:hypothetical protein B0H13DRAFT_1894405 [Mycena leptocephala]